MAENQNKKSAPAKTSGKKTTTTQKTTTVPEIGGSKKKSPAKAKQDYLANAKKNGEYQELRSPALGSQQKAIILFACGILFLAIAAIKGSNFWLVLHDSFYGLFGMCALLIPVALILVAVLIAADKKPGRIKYDIIGGSIFMVLFASIVHVIRFKKEVLPDSRNLLNDVGVFEQIAYVWKVEHPLVSGGSVGAFFGGLIAKLLGSTGTIVFIAIVLVVLFMFLSGTTLVNLYHMVSKPVQKAGELANDRMEQHEVRAAERAGRKKKFVPPDEVAKSKKDEKPADGDDDGIIKDENAFVIRDGESKDPSGMKIPVINMPDAAEPDNYGKPVNKAKNTNPADIMYSDVPPTEEIAVPGEEKVKPAKKTVKVPKKEDIELPELDDYTKPSIDCLDVVSHVGTGGNQDEIRAAAQKLIATLESFGVKARVVNVAVGPSVTRYEIEPDEGVRINKITNLADDIALRLASAGVRIAPIPNKSAVGIEVPNKVRDTVGMREIIDTAQFSGAKSKLNVALGKDISGNLVFADLAKMPHLLIAGTTGSGKSVCLNTMIVSILYNATPDEVKIILIDPKQVEFSVYNEIGHLVIPVVANPRKAAGALGWAVGEMEKRYHTFSENNVRDIKGYNRLCETKLSLEKMPQIVIFIDELSDLMMVAPNEVEDSICRLAQMARAAGMHLVVATQRPSVNVITGVIKANIPSRIALSVSSQIDSRTILDTAGAEKLLGNGDMLFSPIGANKPLRVQGAFISDAEVERVVEHIKSKSRPDFDADVMKEIDNLAKATEDPKKKSSGTDDAEDTGITETQMLALEAAVKAGKISTTFLQNKLGWGYPKAARIVGELEEKGFISTKEGSKERYVNLSLQQLYQLSGSSGGEVAPLSGDYSDYSGEEEEELPFDIEEEGAPAQEDDGFSEDDDDSIKNMLDTMNSINYNED